MSGTQKRSNKDHRPQIAFTRVEDAHKKVMTKMRARLEEKGSGAWLSRHEILGFVTEEYDELITAVHGESKDRIREELLDIAVACVFAIACIDSDTLDW